MRVVRLLRAVFRDRKRNRVQRSGRGRAGRSRYRTWRRTRHQIHRGVSASARAQPFAGLSCRCGPRVEHNTATLESSRSARRFDGRSAKGWEVRMAELSSATRDALLRVGTSTLTGILSRRGIRNMFLQDVWPIRPDMPRMVGPAFTMRFIPAREDKTATGRGPVQQRAMEECPPGHVLVVDSRGDPRAASAGDIYCGRLKARGCAGVVTDGGLRDTEGVFKTGLPAYHRRPSSPPSGIVHQPV